MSEEQSRLVNECKRIEINSLWNASAHFTAASLSGWAHGILGICPIILGALGGWKFLTDPQLASPGQIFFAGLATLTAGIIGSLMSFWNLTKVRLEHFSAAVKYKSLENDARRAAEIHSQDEGYPEFKARVMELAKRYDEAGASSTQSLDLAFWVAGRKIRKGIYSTDPAKDSGNPTK